MTTAVLGQVLTLLQTISPRSMTLTSENILRSAIDLLRENSTKHPVRWPYRASEWQSSGGGYIVWRDVYEGNMRCTLQEAVEAHKVARFVCQSDAEDYAKYRNEMTARYGTDNVHVIQRS
jgi:hypothetical protein